jgi:hypothetical protein
MRVFAECYLDRFVIDDAAGGGAPAPQAARRSEDQLCRAE